jgi:hypothetical protein
MLKPEDNILSIAIGSSTGYKHSEASLELIRSAALNRKRHAFV